MSLHLVTGGSGFLGNLIARRLLEKGESVRILDIVDDPSRPADIEFIQCDILDREKVKTALKGVDVVHHNVALVPLTKSGKKFRDVNVTGTIIAAEESVKAGVKGFIHMSSSAIFGLPECPITSSTKPNPVEIYGRAKLEGEKAVIRIMDAADLPYVIIRPRTLLGLGRLGIFQILFEWINENRNVYVIGSGNMKFQFLHAHDLMDAYMLLLDKGKTGAYNVGAAEFGTLRDALENLIQFATSTSKVKSLPEKLSIGTLQLLDKIGLSPLAPWHYLTYHKPFYFDVNPLLDLGWQPKYSNDAMFRESYQWFLDHRNDQSLSGDGAIHRKPVKEKILKLVKHFS